MPGDMRRVISGFAILVCAWPARAQSPDESARFFEMRIRPLFEEKCAGCHSDEKRASGLSLENQRGFASGGNRGPVAIAGKPEESRIIQAVEQSGALKMPPGGKLRADQIEDLRNWVRAGMPWPEAALPACRSSAEERPLGIQSSGTPAAACRPQCRVAAQSDRPVRTRASREGESRALARSRSRHADPPPEPGPDRAAAHARGNRRVSRRPPSRCLRPSGGSPARLAALRRALGTPLAGCGALRRHQRLRLRQSARDVALPRLGDQRAQSRHAVRRVHDRATGRRLAAARHARSENRHRLPSQHHDQRGRRRRPGAVPHRGAVRPRGDHGHGFSGPDDRLRPVPRSQIRSHQAARVLPAHGVLQQPGRAQDRGGARAGCGALPPHRGRFPGGEAEGRERDRAMERQAAGSDGRVGEGARHPRERQVARQYSSHPEGSGWQARTDGREGSGDVLQGERCRISAAGACQGNPGGDSKPA